MVVLGRQFGLPLALAPRIGVQAGWPGLRWAVPVASASASAAIIGWVFRRRRHASLFAAYFMFSALNSLLQIVAYMVF
jgi:hypothetical protein